MIEKCAARKNEKGAVMVIALMMLAILTLIGLTAARNGSFELKMAENDAAFRQALYNADSGVSFALRLREADIEDLMPGDAIPATPENSRFQLRYIRQVDPGPPTVIEIRSEVGPDISKENTKLVNSKGAASVVAGIQLPTPMTGQISGPGDEFEYTN